MGDVFDSAVGRLYDEITHVGLASSTDVVIITAYIESFLRHRFGGTPYQQAEDAAQSAIGRFSIAVQRGGVRKETAPQFLMEIARNVAKDLARKDFRGRELPMGWAELATGTIAANDDEVSALLDRNADSERVRTALRRAVADGRHDVVRTVRTWLNLACQLGRAPGSREVGAKVGVSHTTVQTHLTTFRSYFPAGPDRT